MSGHYHREPGRLEHRTSAGAGGRTPDRGSAGRSARRSDEEYDRRYLRRYDGYDDEDEGFGRGWRWYQQADRNASLGEDHASDYGDSQPDSASGGGSPGHADRDT